MKLPRSSQVVDRLLVLPTAGSTNDELVARAGAEPDFAVIVTDDQTAGRGRLGREWVAPAGQTLAISVLLRPALDLEHFGWLPLIAGAAMTAAVSSVLTAERVGLKWPNDVQVDGLKVCGVLAELLPAATAVVIGAGVNLSQRQEELPTPTSTSLGLVGAALAGDELGDAVLAAYLTSLRDLYDRFVGAAGDAEASGIRSLVTELCVTLGRTVRVELPGGGDLVGVATGIDGSGRLLVAERADGRVTAVAAGDVTHLRYE